MEAADPLLPRPGAQAVRGAQALHRGIREKVLIQQLRELAAAGVLVRRDYQRVPPVVEYTMTEFGMSLARALMPLCDWGTEHRAHVVETVLSRSPEWVEAAADCITPGCSSTS